MNYKKIILLIVIFLNLGLVINSFASNNDSYMQNMQKKIFKSFDLSNKYCRFTSTVKRPTFQDMSTWIFTCETPKGEKISKYLFLNISIMGKTEVLLGDVMLKDGAPSKVTGISIGKNAFITYIWKLKKSNYLIHVQATENTSNLVGAGIYNRNLAKKYPHTTITSWIGYDK